MVITVDVRYAPGVLFLVFCRCVQGFLCRMHGVVGLLAKRVGGAAVTL
jgi:hypothetical protein